MSGWTQVGECPKCGAPIYAPTIWHGVMPPPKYRTCDCFKTQGELKTSTNVLL